MKRSLLFVLAISLLLELYLVIRTFTDSAWLPGSFGLETSDGVKTLNHIIAWFLLLVTLLIVAGIIGVARNRREGISICWLLGLWWIGIGIGIWFVSGQTTNLITDSIKGAIIVLLAAAYRRSAILS